MSQCALRAFVSQRRQLPPSSFRGHPGSKPERWIDRFEQGLIEEFGVQARYPHGLPLEFFAQHSQCVTGAIRTDVRGPGQPPQCFIILGRGQHVRPLQALQLEPMLKQSQKLVRGGQIRRIIAADITTRSQRGQSFHRRCDV